MVNIQLMFIEAMASAMELRFLYLSKVLCSSKYSYDIILSSKSVVVYEDSPRLNED